MFVCVAWALTSTPQGMPGTHPPIFWLGGRQREYPTISLRTFGYSKPILVALRSLSLKPISFGYKTPPIRFSQAVGSQGSPPPNLQLALTPLIMGFCKFLWAYVSVRVFAIVMCSKYFVRWTPTTMAISTAMNCVMLSTPSVRCNMHIFVHILKVILKERG